MENKKGILIAAMGLPSVGKSSVIKELGRLLGCKTLLEKEEAYWGQAIVERDKTDDFFTANMFFRCMRVPYYHEAKRLIDKSEEIVLLDTFYDKLAYLYMDDKDNFGWIFKQDDPHYYPYLKEISRLDYEKLTDADYIIFINISKDVWERFALKRGRVLDKDDAFLKSFEGINKMKEAVYKYKADRVAKGKKLEIVEIDQAYDSAHRIALNAFAKLLKYPEIVSRVQGRINVEYVDEYIKKITALADDPVADPEN